MAAVDVGRTNGLHWRDISLDRDMDRWILPDTTGVLRALSDGTRVRLTALLEREELTVAELSAVTRLAQPRVSTHLAKLKDIGLVRDRRAGVSAYYRFNAEAAPALVGLWHAAARRRPTTRCCATTRSASPACSRSARSAAGPTPSRATWSGTIRPAAPGRRCRAASCTCSSSATCSTSPRATASSRSCIAPHAKSRGLRRRERARGRGRAQAPRGLRQRHGARRRHARARPARRALRPRADDACPALQRPPRRRARPKPRACCAAAAACSP